MSGNPSGAPELQMTKLPEDAVKRIGDTRRQAESDLQASLRLIEGEDITPFLVLSHLLLPRSSMRKLTNLLVLAMILTNWTKSSEWK